MHPSSLRLARFLALLSALAAPLAAPLAQAQGTDFPQRPVTFVVPFAPGGSMDALARITATKLSPMWGRPVVVENRPGAGGLVGAQRVKAAPADGYTLLVTNSALIQTVVPSLNPNPPYNPLTDFLPVAHMTLAPVVYAINPKLPAKNLQEFIALVKKEPKKFSFGSGGPNQTLHLLGAVLNDAAGLEMIHVPFKGDAALVTDLMAGHISAGFATIATARPHIDAGNLRALAVAGPRAPALPDVPTFRELGFTQLDVVGWFGMFAPAGTPKAVVDKVYADVNAVLKMSDVDSKLKELSLTPTGLAPAEFAKIVARDLGYWDAVVKKVGEK